MFGFFKKNKQKDEFSNEKPLESDDVWETVETIQQPIPEKPVRETKLLKYDIETESVHEVTFSNEQPQPPDTRQKNVKYQPSKNGLYPDEILMLSMATKFKLSGNKFPGYWQFNYGVTNPQQLLNNLNLKGFIVPGGVKETLSTLSTTILKEELSAAGLKTSGKKTELVDRLVLGVDNAVLESKYPDKYYKLTELGEQELKENEYVPYLHENKLCGIWKMNNLLYFENPSHLNYRDYLWSLLNKKSLYYYGQKDFGMYRSVHLSMYNMLMEEERYQGAFQQLAEVLYFDMSGLTMSAGAYNIDKQYFVELILKDIKDNIKNCNSYITMLVPAATDKWLPDIKKKLNIESDEEFYTALLEQFKNIDKRCPFHAFTPEESARLCISEMNGDGKEIILLYKQAEQRMKDVCGKRQYDILFK